MVVPPGSVHGKAIQAGGNSRCLPRNSKMINGDLRLEGEEEDDTRAGRRMRSGEAREGNLDGNRSESSGRERHSYCEDQEEMQSESGQMFGAGPGTDIEGDSGRKLGWPTVLTLVLGLVFWAALRPVSSTRSLLDGLSSYEPTCPKVRDAAAESGLCQEEHKPWGRG